MTVINKRVIGNEIFKKGEIMIPAAKISAPAQMVKTKMTEKRLLTAAAVAERLSLSKRAVFRMRSAGLICAPLKCGQGAIRWRLSDIEKWISMGCCSQKEFEARQEVVK